MNREKYKDNILVIILIIVASILILFSFFSPSIFTRPGNIDFSDTGEIGNTIDGLMSPFIAIAGVILTFAAFYIQFKANQQQIAQIKNQESKDRKLSIENKILTMLSYHRENVKDLEVINNGKIIKGQRVIEYFCLLIDQIKQALEPRLDREPDSKFDEKDLTIASYLYFTFGNRVYNNDQIKDKYSKYLNESIVNVFPPIRNDDLTIFNGYDDVLSRYFRQLYQIIKYIDQNTTLDYNEKYYYAKMVRSTLSNNEQMLLFYNVLSPLGKAWIEEKLILKYKLIKNIPVYAIYGYKPTTWFIDEFKINKSELNKYFEIYE